MWYVVIDFIYDSSMQVEKQNELHFKYLHKVKRIIWLELNDPRASPWCFPTF